MCEDFRTQESVLKTQKRFQQTNPAFFLGWSSTGALDACRPLLLSKPDTLPLSVAMFLRPHCRRYPRAGRAYLVAPRPAGGPKALAKGELLDEGGRNLYVRGLCASYPPYKARSGQDIGLNRCRRMYKTEEGWRGTTDIVSPAPLSCSSHYFYETKRHARRRRRRRRRRTHTSEHSFFCQAPSAAKAARTGPVHAAANRSSAAGPATIVALAGQKLRSRGTCTTKGTYPMVCVHNR